MTLPAARIGGSWIFTQEGLDDALQRTRRLEGSGAGQGSEGEREADRQRRIEECAKEIRYWHRMQADMGHAGKNLREILFRYIT